MSQIVDFSTSNSEITDEVINVANSNAINLALPIFYDKSGKELVVWTASGKSGTQLTETTDYTLGGAFSDSDLPASISPDVAYTTISITNATYHNTNLYVSYYPISGLFNASLWNSLTSPSETSYDISSSNQTHDLTFAIGQPQDYTFIVRATGGDGSGTYKLTFTNAGANTIGGITATDWEFLGDGYLKLQWDKANSNFRVINYGDVWDSWDETFVDISADYPQEKFLDGSMIRRGSVHSNKTEGAMYDLISSHLPNVGDTLGAWSYATASNIIMKRTASDTITSYYIIGASGALGSETYKSDSSGTATTQNHSGEWETKNVRWTTSTPVIG